MGEMPGEDFDTQIECAIERLHGLANQCPWRDRGFYALWLAQTYYYVTHTTRLVALAASRVGLGEGALHESLLKKAMAERNHEKLALHDLEAMGYSITQFEELPQTSFFYQTLFFLISQEGPHALLGYSLLLEGIASTKMDQVYETVLKSHGPDASTFLKAHCQLDREHFKESLVLARRFEPATQAVIVKAARECEAVFIAILLAMSRRQGFQFDPSRLA